MPLPGLTADEARLLVQSVGWRTHKTGRPLMPTEVGDLFTRAVRAGASLDQCGAASSLSPSNVSRFVRVASLPTDVRHLVSWGSPQGAVGFTTAVEIARVKNPDDQRALARAVLEQGLSTAEVRQAVQLASRSSRSFDSAIQESVGMRPRVERRYVFVGAVGSDGVTARLKGRTQVERNEILAAALRKLGLTRVSGTMGDGLYTLVGGESAQDELAGSNVKQLERRLAAALEETLADG